MNLMRKHGITGPAVMGLTVALAGSVFADGYRNPPPTAQGIGKSGANSVFVDDASAISYNPANLVFVKGSSIVINATLAKTENSYNNPFNPAGRVDSNDEWIPLPNLYISLPSGYEGVAFGVGLTTPYGQGIDWVSTDMYNPYAPISLYQAQISLVNINPSVAFRLGDRFSVGIGADIYYSELEFNALVGAVSSPVPPAPGAAPTGRATAEGDGYGYGGNIGITWQVTDSQRAVLTYRSEVRLDYEGDLTVTPGGALASSSFGLGVTYPNMVTVGYGVELSDQLRVEAGVEWLEWSSTQNQIADLGVNDALPMPQNWDDTFTLGIGADWQFTEHWVVRGGYAFIESPIPDSTVTPLLPDADRHAISAGLGYSSGAHALDLAYTFSIYDDRSSPATATAPGTYDIASELIGMTYSYSF